MKLEALIQDLAEAQVIGDPTVEVRAVRDDSRLVEPGDLFVAVKGLRVDGRAFIPTALRQGAVAVVLEDPLSQDQIGPGVTQVVVPQAVVAACLLAMAQAGHPAKHLGLVGITGTNGKTTCSYLVEAVLRAAGHQPGVLGTVNYRYGGRVESAPYTTPTPRIMHSTLAEMVAAGCSHAVLEVSSAALAQDRMTGLAMKVAGFTNLTQDHLDLHGSMEAYQAAKERLFRDHLADDGVAVINVDDPAAPAMLAAAHGHRILRVSSQPGGAGDVRVERAESTIEGIRATLITPRGRIEIHSPVLLGDYNLANIALVIAIGEALGLEQESMAQGFAKMSGVPGRLERVSNAAGLDILVDYAHTPDALDNVLRALRPLTQRRLICVFGCGGDRDPGKRPQMGAVVAERADVAVITSDNPRTEDPQAIIDQILPSVPEPFFVHPDRRIGIAAAVCEATPGDIVLIAGKGHETYQIIGHETRPFDDREQARLALATRWRFPLAALAEVSAARIAQRPEGAEASHDHAPWFSRVIIDGRQAAAGDLYCAIRGHHLDGHDFCVQAVEAGATGVLVARDHNWNLPEAASPGAEPGALPPGLAGAWVLEVDDPRAALAAIARWHRRRWADEPVYPDAQHSSELGQASAKPVVGVTGSAGKTSTKALIAAALSARYVVCATPGSRNNETGVPLSLLGLMRYHDAAVIEMGMRGLGQIDELVRIAEPTVGAVVNAGSAHLGVVGSVAAIAQGKGEIFGRLSGPGVAVYPADDPRLARYAQVAPRRMCFSAGSVYNADNVINETDAMYEPESDVLAQVNAVDYALASDSSDQSAVRVGFEIIRGGTSETHAAQLNLIGRHNAANAACALACALAAGVAAGAAASSLRHARTPALRGQIVELAGRHILIDCYNANPASMRAALDTVAELAAGGSSRALAVLGDMLELGDEAESAHQAIARYAHRLGVAIVALGEYAHALTSAQTTSVPAQEVGDPDVAARVALDRTSAGDWIVIKASRGLRLERVVAAMKRLVHDSDRRPDPSLGAVRDPSHQEA